MEENREMINNFSDMVNAAERLVKPWKMIAIITNILWAIVLTIFVMLAYLTPMEYDVDQNQNQDDVTQSQNYSSTFTEGK